MATKKAATKVVDDWMPKCASCAFFSLDEPNDETGYCKRYPPVFAACEEGAGWTFAVSFYDDWCGEFLRKSH